MGNFEVIARLKIRAGQLDGFKEQAAEVMRLTREQDTKTVRYDWFVDEDAMECEVHEEYLNEDGLIEHNMHVVDARNVMFEKYAYDHRMSFYGDVSQRLVDLAKTHAGGAGVFAFFHGLDSPAPVSS